MLAEERFSLIMEQLDRKRTQALGRSAQGVCIQWKGH